MTTRRLDLQAFPDLQMEEWNPIWSPHIHNVPQMRTLLHTLPDLDLDVLEMEVYDRHPSIAAAPVLEIIGQDGHRP